MGRLPMRRGILGIGGGLGGAALILVAAGNYAAAAGAGVLPNSPSSFESGDGVMTVTTSGDSDWNCFLGDDSFQQGTPPGSPDCNVISANAQQLADPYAYTTSDISWVSGQKQDTACPLLQTSKDPAKDSLTNVARYSEEASTGPAAGDLFLYGATIRVSANGNASENVELNQGNEGKCPAQTFTQHGTSVTIQLYQRSYGDLLLAFNYLNGGTSLDLHALTWIDDTNAPTSLDAGGNNGTCYVSHDNPPCWGANVTNPAGSSFNGEANQAGISAEAFTNPLSGAALSAGEFAEFGVNLAQAGIVAANSCFNAPQTLWESRSSGSSFTSNPEDIEVQQQTLSTCSSSTVTTPSVANTSPGVPGSVSIGTTTSGSSADLSETDSATIAVTGVSSFGGTVTFSLCGPSALTSTANCASGGTTIGSSTVSGSGGTATVTSPTATITKVGLYCWRADYSGASTQGVPPSSDPGSTSTSQSECFKVTPVTPTLSTSASISNKGVLPATITDTATLSGTANGPGSPVIGTTADPSTLGGVAQGTITFTAYGPNSCTTQADTSTVNVTGDGSYTSTGFSAPAPGTYVFVASYSGDSPNTNASVPVACSDEPSAEAVMATDTSSASSAQTWLPNDTATITSGSGTATLEGTLTIQLYEGSGTCASTDAVSGQLYTDTVGTPTAKIVFSTTNKAYTVAASDTVSWLVTFTSSNPDVLGSSHCESSTLTVTN